MKYLVLLLNLQMVYDAYGFYINAPLVKTPLGDIRGNILQSEYKDPIYQFLGVRYATLEDNNSKSRPARLVSKWSNVYNATSYGTQCPSPESKEVSEDCLFLNVFTTKLPENHKNTKRQVLVLLHPGGYRFGQKSAFDPYIYLDQDNIIVAVNYRLTHIDERVNEEKKLSAGAQDIGLALKWVKENIEGFGGNSNTITVALFNFKNFHTPIFDLLQVSNLTFMRVYIMNVENQDF